MLFSNCMSDAVAMLSKRLCWPVLVSSDTAIQVLAVVCSITQSITSMVHNDCTLGILHDLSMSSSTKQSLGQ